jgi:hypothetical protein
MSSPILARADALMHRRRPSSAEPDDIPVLTDAIDRNDEIPVLVDVEPNPAPAELPSTREASAVPGREIALDSQMLDSLAQELARRVHARLAAELPAIVEDTIRDFLAEPDILALLRPRD